MGERMVHRRTATATRPNYPETATTSKATSTSSKASQEGTESFKFKSKPGIRRLFYFIADFLLCQRELECALVHRLGYRFPAFCSSSLSKNFDGISVFWCHWWHDWNYPKHPVRWGAHIHILADIATKKGEPGLIDSRIDQDRSSLAQTKILAS